MARTTTNTDHPFLAADGDPLEGIEVAFELVTYQGEHADTSMLHLTPGDVVGTVVAITDAAGVFETTLIPNEGGAPATMYRVTVRWPGWKETFYAIIADLAYPALWDTLKESLDPFDQSQFPAWYDHVEGQGYEIPASLHLLYPEADALRADTLYPPTEDNYVVTKDRLASTPGTGGGSAWHTGTGVPDTLLGANGDMYLDDATGDYYQKASDVWSVEGNLTGPAGPTGPQGDQGIPGAKGDQGDQGIQGPPGVDGEDGSGIQYMGVDTWANISAIPTPAQGDAWVLTDTVGSPPTRPDASPAQAGDWIIYDLAAWTNSGPRQGEKGDQGDQGVPGDKGDQGIQGPQGPQGPEGPQGIQGVPGADGSDGGTGPAGPAGPSTPSADPNNRLTVGTDSLLYSPPVTPAEIGAAPTIEVTQSGVLIHAFANDSYTVVTTDGSTLGVDQVKPARSTTGFASFRINNAAGSVILLVSGIKWASADGNAPSGFPGTSDWDCSLARVVDSGRNTISWTLTAAKVGA